MARNEKLYTVDDLVNDLRSGTFRRSREISLRDLGVDVLVEIQNWPDGPRLIVKKPSGQETIKLNERDLLNN